MTTTAMSARRRNGTTPAPALTLAAGMLGFFMTTIDVSAVNVALATMGRDLRAATDGLQWVVDGYTLMFAALLLSAGALSDRIGARRAYASGVAGFALASVACGIAPGLGILTGARFVQGCAAAVMLPSSLALVRQAFDDPARRARAIALWTVAGSVAVAAGPVIGGLLVSAWSWRGIFLINVPAVLATAAFAVIESRVAAPMVPLRLFRGRATLVVLGTGFAINTAWYGIVFVIGLYAQQVRGASALATGLMFVPMALGITLTNVASPTLAARRGPGVPLVAGMLVTVGGLIGLVWAGPVWRTALLMIPFGVVGLSVPTLIIAMLESVPASQAGLAGGVLNASRQVGSAMGVALFGGLLGGHDFRGGMIASLVISAAVLAAAAGANAVTFRPG